MLPLITSANQTSNTYGANRASRNETDFFKAAANYIPPVAEASPTKNENKASNQPLVASSTTFLAQLIGQNDNVAVEGPYQQLVDFSLVKYMPSYASYPSNNNEQLELFPEGNAASPEEVASAQATATYAQAETIDLPQPASKVISII